MANIAVSGPFEILKTPLTVGAFDGSPPGRDGLLGWWKLGEENGSCAADLSGRGATAQLHGVPHWLLSGDGSAGGIELDGASNYLACAESVEFGALDCLSFGLWFKAPKSDPANRRVQVLMVKGEAWQLQRRAHDGTVELLLAGLRTPTNSPAQGRSPVLTSSRKLDDGEWHHAAGVYDGRRATLYIDGEEESAIPASGQLALTTAPVSIGESTVSRGRFFPGCLADIRIYGRALEAKELREIYQTGRSR